MVEHTCDTRSHYLPRKVCGRQLRTRSFLSLLIVGSIVLFTSGLSSASALRPIKSPPTIKAVSQARLSECISENHELSVLFLVDESMSLRDTSKGKGTDPENRRVDGIKAALSSLSASASIDSATQINVRFLGFGQRVEKRSDWIQISNGDELDKVASEFEKFNNSNNTDYIDGLNGSLSSFVKRNDDLKRPNCKLLVWLTDGVYDTDGATKLSVSELGALNNRLCNDGGVVDELREIGATVVAIGLSNNNKTDFSWLEKVVGDIPGCGRLEPNGWFIPVVNASALVDELFEGVSDPVAGPKALGSQAPCSDKPIDCTEIAFDVSELVTTFQVLVQPQLTPGSSAQTSVGVTLIAPNNALSINVLPEAARNDVIQVKKFNDARALIRVDFTQEASKYWVGIWRIRFEGPEAEKSKALAVFLSDYKIVLADGQDPIIDRVKSKTQPIKLALASTLVPKSMNENSESVIPELKAVAKATQIQELIVQATGEDKYEIASDQVSSLFEDPKSDFSLASAISIEFTPQVQINGMSIAFGSERISFSLRDGVKYPSVSVGEVTNIDQKKSATVKLRLTGPQQGDGIVKVLPKVLSVIDGPDGKTPEDFSISGISQDCIVIEATESDGCKFQISANFQANSELTLIVPVEIDNRQANNSDGPKEVNLRISLTMTKPINKAATAWAGIGLLILFIAVQLLLRLGFAIAMSRFEPLPAGSRRVTKSILISSSGQLMNSDGSRFSISNEDTSLVFDMDKAFRSLTIDGFEFSVSRLKTFITQKPVGIVLSENEQVFGSLNTTFKAGVGVGTIALAPRKQWAIAMTQGNLLLLANGEPSVDARMIIFIDDLSRSPLNEQVSELLERITTTSFASDLTRFLENLRTLPTSKSDPDVVDPVETPGNTEQIKITEVINEKYFDPNDPLN